MIFSHKAVVSYFLAALFVLWMIYPECLWLGAAASTVCWAVSGVGYNHLLLPGEPVLPGESVSAKSLPPEKLLKEEPCPLQAEQSTRADGDKDFADMHICSVQEQPCVSERAPDQLESSQLH